MWGRTALVLTALVAGFGLAAPAAAAPSRGVADSAATHQDATTQELAADVASCRAVLVAASQWTGGFYGQVTVMNTGNVPIRWQVTIIFPGAIITPPPGYIVVQNGTSWLIYPPPTTWNGILPVGASVSFGFLATTTGTVGTPIITCTATPA